jgi:DNA polymerase III subunit gamma/tau
MSQYKPLATILRPQFFNQFVYNEPIITIVKAMISNNTMPNGLIISGTRGIGKTTLARIVARSLNCTARPQGGAEPCGECPSCLESLEGSHPDIVEIDGATHAGVDDVKHIVEQAQHTPMLSDKKIFIVDEAHNLARSVASWDVLLKILEEPPDHVFWIFCTTQKHKIPVVIKSRLVTLDLKMVPFKVTSNYIYSVLKWLNKEVADEDAGKIAAAVAQASGNSLRDSLTLLEKVIPYCTEKGWTLDNALVATGSFDLGRLNDILSCLANRDATKLWLILDELLESGVDLEVILNAISDSINKLLSIALGVSVENAEIVQGWASYFPPSHLLCLADLFMKRYPYFDSSTNKKMVLQVLVLELVSC